MSETNPYAYTEESVAPRNIPQGTQEPHLPITIWLKHKRGMFSSHPCNMTVTENDAEITGEHLTEPIVIERNSADSQIKLRLLDMIVRGNNGRKYRMIYSKDDSDRSLALARLEAWLHPEQAEDADEAYGYILKRLKHWTCGLVKNWLLCLSVLQFLVLILFVVLFAVQMSRPQATVNRPQATVNFYILTFLLIWVGFLITMNLLMLFLLKAGKMGALYGVITVYTLFLLMSLSNVNIVGIIIGISMILMSLRAKKDFNRLQSQIGGLYEG